MARVDCSGCHRTFGVRPDVLKQRLEKTGAKDAAALSKTYKCRDCRALAKEKAQTQTTVDKSSKAVAKKG